MPLRSRHRWPVAVEKAELVNGVMVFTGEFDGRDAEIAQRTYPGRQVLLTDGALEVHPQSDVPARPLAETAAERRAEYLPQRPPNPELA